MFKKESADSVNEQNGSFFSFGKGFEFEWLGGFFVEHMLARIEK